MTIIPIDRSQNHQHQQASLISLQPVIDSPNKRAKFTEFLYDSQLEGGQRYSAVKAVRTRGGFLRKGTLTKTRRSLR